MLLMPGGVRVSLAELMRGVSEVISESLLKERLDQGEKLKVKLGLDPTASDIHLGHTVVLNKLRHFQEQGHQVMFLVGDFTAMIGDPTGKNVTRQPLTQDQVMAHAKTYQDQVFKILDPENTTILYNSTWLEALGASGIIELASTYTVARMLERDDFEKRYRTMQPIAVHEFLYPLLQGYDSVKMEADVEIGGTDQKFNLLVGRELQKHYKMRPQVVMTMPLLEGTDGVKKMSKSLDNFIGINEPANEIYGKIMSLSDELMWRYYDLLSFLSVAEIATLRQSAKDGRNPRDIKMELACELVARFCGKVAARNAEQDFVSRFRHQMAPQDIPVKEISVDERGVAIGYLLQQVGLVGSISEAMRLVNQGAVKLDGSRVEDQRLVLFAAEPMTVQVGKRRVARVKLVLG